MQGGYGKGLEEGTLLPGRRDAFVGMCAGLECSGLMAACALATAHSYQGTGLLAGYTLFGGGNQVTASSEEPQTFFAVSCVSSHQRKLEKKGVPRTPLLWLRRVRGDLCTGGHPVERWPLAFLPRSDVINLLNPGLRQGLQSNLNLHFRVLYFN